MTLLDPLGRVLLKTEPYTTAKDGQAWLLANGTWQWTTRPTPNALNVVSAPVAKTKTAKTTAPSKRRVPSSRAAAGPSQGQDTTELLAAVATKTTPLHPGVLALIGVSAVLYGAYEYRRDVANRIYQFRSNRAARAALRRGTEGR